MKNICRKLFGLVLVLVLVLSMIPAAAAEEPAEYNLWLGETRVTETNKDDILNDGKAQYDPETKTLTLDGPTITGSSGKGALIYAEYQDLVVVAKSPLTLTADQESYMAIDVWVGNLTLKGTITASSAYDHAIRVYGDEKTGGSLTVDGELTATCTHTENSIDHQDAINVSNTVTVTKDGKLTAKGSQFAIRSGRDGEVKLLGKSAVLEGGNTSVLTKGTVTIDCDATLKGSDDGIVCKDLKILGGTVSFQSLPKDSDGESGVYAEGDVIISGGTVTATGGLRGFEVYGKLNVKSDTAKVTADGDWYALYAKNGIVLGKQIVVKEPAGAVLNEAGDKLIPAPGSTENVQHAVLERDPSIPNIFTVTVEEAENGTVEADKTEAKEDDKVSLTVTPAENFILDTLTVTTDGGAEVTLAEDKSFTMPADNVTVKAAFKAEVVTYTVTFDSNGGSGEMEAAKVNAGEKYTLPECGFEAPENQEFDAWDAGKPGDEIDVAGDMTVKALWKDLEPPTPDTFTITFDANGGSGEMEAAKVNAGEKYTLPECGFEAPENQEFDAWDVGKPGDEIDVTGNMTVKALWKDKTVQTFTVTFMSNGGSAVEPQTVNENETAQKPANPSKNGYAFAGWFSDKALTQAYDFASPVTADITLYAKWNPIAYTVKFETDGGSMVAEQMVQSGKLAVKPKDPTKEGFVFAGWYSDKELTQAFDFKTPIAANITLYAKWDQSVKYEVSAISSATVTKGKSAKLEITVKRDPDNDVCFEHFDSVQMDGKELTKGTDYTAKSGSTVITFKNAYLNKLTSGTHTVTILFDDGKAAARIVIKAGTGGGGAPAARTGDESTPGLWIGLLAGSAVILIGLVVFLLLRAKRKNAPSQEAPAEAPAPVREEPEPTDPESKDPESKE